MVETQECEKESSWATVVKGSATNAAADKFRPLPVNNKFKVQVKKWVNDNNNNYIFASFNIYGIKMYNISYEIVAYLKTHYIDCLILTKAYQDNNDNCSL